MQDWVLRISSGSGMLWSTASCSSLLSAGRCGILFMNFSPRSGCWPSKAQALSAEVLLYSYEWSELVRYTSTYIICCQATPQSPGKSSLYLAQYPLTRYSSGSHPDKIHNHNPYRYLRSEFEWTKKWLNN